MHKTLFLFVTSENPDPYLNSVAHCVLNANITRIIFLHIVDLTDFGVQAGRQKSDGFSEKVKDSVKTLLTDLSEGRYRYFTGEKSGEVVDLEDEYESEKLKLTKQFYQRCLAHRLRWHYEDIKYHEVRNQLSRIHEEETEARLDITAIKRRFLGDLVAACITEKIHNLSTFDIGTRPNYDSPWRMLIHDLQDLKRGNKFYEHVNILDTPIFLDCKKHLYPSTQKPKSFLEKIRGLTGTRVASALFFIVTALYFTYGAEHPAVGIVLLGGSFASLVSLVITVYS